jgi:F-type H+-transporting ATPase subunit gamma
MRRLEIESRLASLSEIREILAAMKNLSLMETHKLSRFIESQRQATATIERAAVDFLQAWPDFLPSSSPQQVVFVVIGSERGFCGDYNEKLLEAAESYCKPGNLPFLRCLKARWLPVGSKLCSRLEGDERVIQPLAGASVAEEVPEVLQQVVEVIERLEGQLPAVAWFGLHHSHGGIRLTSLLPPFQQLRTEARVLPGAPFTYLEPGALFPQLVDQYLFALLNTMFFEALLAEHQQRVQNLAGAIDRLDERCRNLRIRRNALRQEEITEEIEMIMLSASAVTARKSPVT